MTPTPYLFFNGTCREALTAYVEIFDGEMVALMAASDMPEDDSPGAIPEDRKDWIMHGMVRLGEGMLMASDNLMGESATMDGSSILMELPTPEAARSVFDKLAEGGEITMPFEATFWSPGFGTLRDRFGIRWMIGTEDPAT